MFRNNAGMECVLKAQQILFMKGKISGLCSQVFTIVSVLNGGKSVRSTLGSYLKKPIL